MSGPSNPDEGSFAQEARTQTFKAVLLIVVAVIVAVLLLHRTGASGGQLSSSPTTRSAAVSVAPTSTTTTPAITIPPAQVKVLVLNGTLKGSLAGELTTKLKGQGYATVTPDNTTSAVTQSAVYAQSTQYQPAATAIATELGLPATDVVVNLPSDAPIATAEKAEANVIIVIGTDLAAKAPFTSVGSSTGSSTGSTTGTTSTTAG